jgi:proton-dependent oligopeptide transporter, POT family
MKILQQQPKALPFLFLTEMWERFGFYVVQGMLVLYMSKFFGFTDSASYTIMGAFSALAYIAPFPGGFLADRVLGFKAAIIIGGIFLSVGYAMLALPWTNEFYLSLATIIVGNGLFKPNVSSLLGSLYEPGDPQREAGFTLFYIGINLGVLLAGLSSGFAKDHFGWHAGFGLASAGLIFGVFIFISGFKHLSNIKNSNFVQPHAKKSVKLLVVLGCFAAIALISQLLQNEWLAKWLLPIAGVLLLIFLLVITYQQQAEQRKGMLILIALILSSVIFWMIFLQLFFSASLFIDRLIDKHVTGFTIPLIHKHVFEFNIPTTAFYSLESIFVILLGPVFAWSWHTLSENLHNPSPFLKFILAILFVGLGFLTLAISTYFYNGNLLVNPWWIVLSYFFITVGEMLLSPIGLSAITTLSPRKIVGMMMGIWFVALGFGGQFAGLLAKLSNIPDNVTGVSALAIYRGAFMDYALIAFGVSIFLFLLYLVLNKIFNGLAIH